MANYTILLIDYEPRSIEMLREPLVQAGFDVEVAEDGELGVEAFERCLPDVTLVEAMLPKLHGLDVCRRLKATEHGKSSAVLIMTSVYKKAAHRRQAQQCGANGYLQKPIAPDDLLACIRSFLGELPTAPVKPHSDHELEIVSAVDSILG